MNNNWDFYTSQSNFSSPKELESLYSGLPDDMVSLTKVIQGLIVHQHETEKFYGFKLPKGREIEPNTRYILDVLEKIIKMDARPLTETRDPQKRFIGLCRDFALLLCSILRHKGIPARIRCGFANYFDSINHVDHWLCEYWNEKEKRWVLVDAETDEMERKHYKLTEAFNNLDVTHDQFWFSSTAWKSLRRGEDENKFGVPGVGVFGAWFVRANLFRDLAALNKIELCPWDYTEHSEKQGDTLKEMPNNELAKLDELAEIITNVNDNFEGIVQFYEINSVFKVGGEITSYTNLGPVKVTLNIS